MPELPVASTFARPAASALANRVRRAFLVSRLLWTVTLTVLVAIVATSAGLRANLGFTRPQRNDGSPPAAAQPPSAPEEKPVKQGELPRSKLTPAQVEAILKAQGQLRDYEFKGHVVDPAGKPVAGANVYVFFAARLQPNATTGPDGRFRFTLKGRDPMKRSRVAAVAGGYAMTGASRAFQYMEETIPDDTPESGRDLTITLVPDWPVTGQVVDPEGKPIAGVSIRPSFVYASRDGRLDRFIQAIKTREVRMHDVEFKYLKRDHVFAFRNIMAREPPPTTDAQGRFVLRGISRESLAILSVDGPTIRPREIRVLTRPGEPFQVSIDPVFPRFGSSTYYGSSPRITVNPGRVVEGIVRDAATGEALPRAQITSEKLADSNVWNNADYANRRRTGALPSHGPAAGSREPPQRLAGTAAAVPARPDRGAERSRDRSDPAGHPPPPRRHDRGTADRRTDRPAAPELTFAESRLPRGRQ